MVDWAGLLVFAFRMPCGFPNDGRCGARHSPKNQSLAGSTIQFHMHRLET
jgi:hypothetical protein